MMAVVPHDYPATYTDSAYPLQYYFEVKGTTQERSSIRTCRRTSTNQPYFVVRH